MCTSFRRWLGRVSLTAVVATLSAGCSSGTGSREGDGSWDAQFYALASSPCDDPLEARQGGCGCIVLESHEAEERALTPPEEPPTEEGRDRREGLSRVRPPHPPRRPAGLPADTESAVAGRGAPR